MKVDNHADLPVYPAQADFTFFGGLYRQVELLIFADKAHFNVTEYGADSLLLTPDVETGTVQASVLCDGGDRLTLIVKDPDGTVVAQEETLSPCKNDALSYRVRRAAVGRRAKPMPIHGYCHFVQGRHPH